jgi:hypothetical protein
MGSIKVTFRDAKGNDIKTIEGNEGDDLLSLAHEHDVDLEGMSRPPFPSPFTPGCRSHRQLRSALLTDRGM